MVSGKYIKKKEKCPYCGENKYLPQHAPLCRDNPDNRDSSDPDIPSIPSDSSGSDSPTVQGDYEIKGSNQDFPKLDQSPLDRMKEKVGQAFDKLKKSGEKMPMMKQDQFRELLKLSDKMFEFFGLPDYRLTDEELDSIVPDLYYLLKKYCPEFLQWMQHDLIRILRLLINVAQIIRSRVIMWQVMNGKLETKDIPKELEGMINTPEFQEAKKLFTDFGGNLAKIKDHILAEKKAKEGSNGTVAATAESKA